MLVLTSTGCLNKSADPPSKLQRAAQKAADWTPPKRADFLKGMTVSCPGNGRIWGTEKMRTALADLDTLGVNWIAIHPYARIGRDGLVRFRPAEQMGYLAPAQNFVVAQKQQLFLKPHLAYWGAFKWRGTIEFEDDQAWERFFTSYSAFILDQAAFAERMKIPLFAVGVELERAVHFEARWRALIAKVRKVYRGRITYAANWDGIARVPFWDALDDIGVQAYFPMGAEGTQDRESLYRAWDGPLQQLAEISKANKDRPVLFTEIGYPRSLKAALQPWVPDTDSDDEAIALRHLLMDVALDRLPRSALIRGVFWWKWIPGSAFFQGDFSMKDPEARAVMKRYWAKGT